MPVLWIQSNRRRSSLFFQCPYNKVNTLIPNITELPINSLINELMNSSNYLERKKNFFKQKETRVDGALNTVHALRVIFENGEPARNGVFGRQKLHVLEKDYHTGIS